MTSVFLGKKKDHVADERTMKRYLNTHKDHLSERSRPYLGLKNTYLMDNIIRRA